MAPNAERDDYDYEKHRADRRIGREKPEDRERREKKKAAVGPEVLKKENHGKGHYQEPERKRGEPAESVPDRIGAAEENDSLEENEPDGPPPPRGDMHPSEKRRRQHHLQEERGQQREDAERDVASRP